MKHKNTSSISSKIVLCIFLGTLPFTAYPSGDEPYSPYVGRDFPVNVYWGDTHLHTSISFDAYSDGNTKMGPEEAYRFAKGEEMIGHDGQPVRISRPLDFIVVADHSEYMGVVQGISTGNELLTATEAGGRWSKLAAEGNLIQVFGEIVHDGATNVPRLVNADFAQSVWDDVGEAADHHNDPGKFTAMIGYEYTSTVEGDNLHRVVIYRDGSDKTNQTVPFTTFDSPAPQDLWAYFENYEETIGGKVMAIPHNGNLSAGKMFAMQDYYGNAFTKEYASNRIRWEPIVETTQIKGDSETHPALSPDDEFADFETWDQGNLAMTKRTSPELMRFEYSRSALKLGLAHEKTLGVNPFKFGMIGATDSHTSWSNAEEDNYLGKYAVATPTPDRWSKKFPPLTIPGVIDQFAEWQSSQSGYAGVWATENTREAIFDAMARKEVYATTGPRMTVRMFGGFDFTESMAYSKDMPAFGYSHGVPMGGDLGSAPDDKVPGFLLSAMKDPDGANLDRIQVVKGWIDAGGESHERIYDVVVSDGRKIENGKATSAVGTTVNLENATYANTIGDAQLLAIWQDPDFDAKVSAFYYTRVLEIPTPRWTAFDEVRFGIQMDPAVPRVLQERAYTSPIWYTP